MSVDDTIVVRLWRSGRDRGWDFVPEIGQTSYSFPCKTSMTIQSSGLS